MHTSHQTQDKDAGIGEGSTLVQRQVKRPARVHRSSRLRRSQARRSPTWPAPASVLVKRLETYRGRPVRGACHIIARGKKRAPKNADRFASDARSSQAWRIEGPRIGRCAQEATVTPARPPSTTPATRSLSPIPHSPGQRCIPLPRHGTRIRCVRTRCPARPCYQVRRRPLSM